MALNPNPQSLLPQNATRFERVTSLTNAERYPLDHQVIRRVWDPYTTPLHMLPYLAAAWSLDIWLPEWDEYRQRSVTARGVELHRIKGTRHGIAEYLKLVDATLLDWLIPPQRVFATAKVSAEQYRKWVSGLPQLRVYFRKIFGVADSMAFLTPEAPFGGRMPFIGHAWARPSTAVRLLGRRAYLYEPRTGVETPLQTFYLKTTVRQAQEPIEQRAMIPGKASRFTAFCGRAIADRGYLADVLVASKAVTYSLGMVYQERSAALRVTTIAPGWEPIDTTSERVPILQTRKMSAFCNRSHAGHCYAFANEAEYAFYDVLFLNDQSRELPSMNAISFADRSWLGQPPYTAKLLVRSRRTTSRKKAFEGRAIGRVYARRDDPRYWRRATEAIRLSKALRDKILVDFRTTRPLRFADKPLLDGGHHLNERLSREHF